MPYEIHIDEAARTIVIRGYGRGTTEATLQLIAQQQQTFHDHPGFNLLYDSSALAIESSPADMMKVAEALFEHGASTFGRIAVVVPASRESLARIFSALAHPHGIQANVFAHVSDARVWLGIQMHP